MLLKLWHAHVRDHTADSAERIDDVVSRPREAKSMRKFSPLLPKLATHACNDNGVIGSPFVRSGRATRSRIAVQLSSGVSVTYVSDGVFVIRGEVPPVAPRAA